MRGGRRVWATAWVIIMAKKNTAPPSSDAREISRLVAKAREEGEPDAFFGKRRWKRYKLGLRLEITTGSSKASDTWSAVMHNISGGGFGFWSKRQLHEGDVIFVREWSDSSVAEWLPAYVTHSTVGIQGHLIGAVFDSPCPADEGTEAIDSDSTTRHDETPSPSHEDELATSKSSGWQDASLGTRFVVVAVLSGLVGVAVTDLVALASSWGWPVGWLWLVAPLAVCSLTGLAGWVTSRRERKYLRTLRTAVRCLAREGGSSFLLEAAPTCELDGLRREFLDFGARWRRREEDARGQRQKLEELTQIKSNILAIVSHDLRTPLTSILLYAQMLHEELASVVTADQLRFLGIINDECNRLSRLVDDLLEVQRLESDRVNWDMRATDLSETIGNCARVFEAMAASKSIAFSMNCPASLPSTEADADKISQVVSNLLSNAIKYTPAMGEVHLHVEVRGQEIVIRVIDNGPGIPREKWDLLFDRFSQLTDANVANVDGFGLGLYIVKRIVDRHGGAAWLDSKVGRGTEFCVSLPTRELTKGRSIGGGGIPAGSVLICDPDPQLAAMLAQTLRWENYETNVCHSGERLLSQLRGGEVDLVITDLMLPDMNASTFFDGLASLNDRAFRLMIHSYTSDDALFARHGVDSFVQRPATREELLGAVNALLGHGGRNRSSVLVVRAGALDAQTLSECLVDDGHDCHVAEGMVEAAARLAKHAADWLVISEHALSGGWPEIPRLQRAARYKARVVVLCDSIRKRDRRLAEEHGAALIPYSVGEEADVMDILLANETTPIPEPIA